MRHYHVLGVPLRTGSLYPGSENDAQAYREAGLLARLEAAGCVATDAGDVAIPSYLPHHQIPPIRSWPGPRIAWDCVGDRLGPLLSEPGHVPLLIGCDCSIVVGTAQALARVADEVHVIYIDGDCDDAAPDPGRCQSAAALAVWLLTNRSPFWAGPPLDPFHVTVVGWTAGPRSRRDGMRLVSLDELRRAGAAATANEVLAAIPLSAAILVHFDIDVFRKEEMPAAYFPHAEGITLAEGAELVRAVVQDSRLRLLEVTEYASLADPDRLWVGKLIDLLATATARSGPWRD